MLSRVTLETGERSAVEGVVVGGADVAEQPDVRRHRLVAPAVAGQQEGAVGQQRGRPQEELLDARLAVGQPVGQQRQVDVEAAGRGRPGGASSGRARCRPTRHSRAPSSV
jgi:hypothetical protein